MAKKIATEQYAYNIGVGKGTPTSNLMVTYTRAIALGCLIRYNTYSSSQLVRLEDLWSCSCLGSTCSCNTDCGHCANASCSSDTCKCNTLTSGYCSNASCSSDTCKCNTQTSGYCSNSSCLADTCKCNTQLSGYCANNCSCNSHSSKEYCGCNDNTNKTCSCNVHSSLQYCGANCGCRTNTCAVCLGYYCPSITSPYTCPTYGYCKTLCNCSANHNVSVCASCGTLCGGFNPSASCGTNCPLHSSVGEPCSSNCSVSMSADCGYNCGTHTTVTCSCNKKLETCSCNSNVGYTCGCYSQKTTCSCNTNKGYTCGCYSLKTTCSCNTNTGYTCSCYGNKTTCSSKNYKEGNNN